MDPRGFPISNLEQYEDPWFYGKVKVIFFYPCFRNFDQRLDKEPQANCQYKSFRMLQRVKAINYGIEDKLLLKKPAKAKLLESLKNDTVSASPKTPPKAKPIQTLATKSRAESGSIARKSLNISLSITKSAPSSQSRRTINGKVERPTNTIKSMFQKQMEKSQTANDSISDQLAAIDLAKVPAPPKPSENVLMAGGLHKRVTRRNSISQISGDEMDSTPKSTPKNKLANRKTMFTPRVSDVFEEEKSVSPAIVPIANGTVNRSAMMDIDQAVTTKCNNGKIASNRSTVVSTPTEDINQKRWLLNSLSKRRTLYTPQAVDETSMLESRLTSQPSRISLKFDTPVVTQDLAKKPTRPTTEKTISTPYGKCDSKWPD